MTDRFLDQTLIAQPDLGERIQRALDLKGDTPNFLERPVTQSIQVLDLERPEYVFLRRQLQFAGGAGATNVAAQFGGIVFGFPLGTAGTPASTMLVVERLRIIHPAAAPIGFNVGVTSLNASLVAPPYVATGVTGPRDFRQLSPTGAFARQARFLSGTNAAQFFATLPFITLPPNGVVDLGPFVLTDGKTQNPEPCGLAVECGTVNTSFNIYVEWTERQALATER